MKRTRILCKHLKPASCNAHSDDSLALSGLRVVEMATVMAAPSCAALLSDFGAEVIKIENPKVPDVVRSWGRGDDPGKTADPALQATVEGGGSSFVQLNRGKKSFVLDPMTPDGNRLLRRLLSSADIFITNVRLKSLRKAGLDYESLCSEFPKLIYGHLSAFGRAGKMVDDPGYDFGAFWAQSGLMDIVRSSDDSPMPREPGGIGDYNTGMQLLGGIFAALYHRERTGKGQLVDASLMRAGVWSMAQPLAALMAGNEYATGENYKSGKPARWWLRHSTELGERHTFTTKAPFRCKDGVWMQLLGNDVGPALPKMIAAFGLTREALLGTDMKNINWAAANRIIDAIISQRSFAEWEPILRKHDVWYVRVNKFEDQCDPKSPAYQQSKAVGSFVEAPGISRHELLGIPLKLSAMEALPRAPAPKFGQHTDAILQELGVSAEMVEQLKSQGVVGVSKGVQQAKRVPPAPGTRT